MLMPAILEAIVEIFDLIRRHCELLIQVSSMSAAEAAYSPNHMSGQGFPSLKATRAIRGNLDRKGRVLTRLGDVEREVEDNLADW
jgi:hypothetical protein